MSDGGNPIERSGLILGASCDHVPIYQRYRATLLLPARVRELSRLRPARAILDTFLCWGRIVAAWTACAIWMQWWVIALALPVIGTSYYAIFILGHDAIHRRVFNSARLNDWFADLFMFAPIGAITRINKWNHLEHHRLLATDADPDRDKYTCFGKADYAPFVAFLTGVQSFAVTANNVFWRAPREARQASTGEDLRYSARDILLLVGWQLVLFLGLTFTIGWWAYFVLWLMPGFAFAFLGNNLRVFCEHSQPEADEQGDTHRLVTYYSNPLERMFIAPLNMNYHAAHHLWPSIPYYNLPQADREIYSHPASNGLEWRKSYLGYVIRYILAMPLVECRTRPVLDPQL